VGSWIQLDLGEKKNICNVDITWYRGSVGRQNNFVISTSDDGTNFVNKFLGKSSGTTSSSEPYGMPAGTEGRYVRITVNGNNENNWASITEIAVFGSDSSSTPPPPITCSKLTPTGVTAIGSDGNVPTNTIDNNLNTRWSNNGVGSWIQLDLGEKKNICNVDIAWYRGSVGRQNNFVISTSDDGTNFVERLKATSSGTTSSLQTYKMPADTTGRYVKITVNGNNENNWASINEITVFGFASTSLPPDGGTNQPPTVDPKSITTSKDTPVLITLTGRDPEGQSLTFNVVAPPAHGTLSPTPQIPADGKVTYTPTPGYTGQDSFSYTAKDVGDATSTNAATVSITISPIDTGTNDKFGIKKIYPTKPGGEEWYMNMQDPTNDPRTKQIPMSKNSDGSWNVDEDQIRYTVYTSSGYHPDLVVKDYSILATRGYMQSPNDWKNVEMTGQVKFNSGSDDDWTWYARGGRNTGNGWPEGCEATEYKGSLEYTSGRVRWAKEQFHVSYVFSPWKNSPASGDHKFVGFKTVMYNFQLDGKTAVKMESYVDPNNDNQWQKVYDFVDKGGWGSAGGECKGAPDQIITWGGPVAAFRWDGANVDIKNLSVREIVPPPTPTQ
jgi:hypothetical protein